MDIKKLNDEYAQLVYTQTQMHGYVEEWRVALVDMIESTRRVNVVMENVVRRIEAIEKRLTVLERHLPTRRL